MWGPYGSPGRTTVSVGIADELTRAGATTVLVDADPYGGAVGLHLGMLEESSGLVAACRRAEQGLLDLPGLARSARSLGGGLRVITGVMTPRPHEGRVPSRLQHCRQQTPSSRSAQLMPLAYRDWPLRFLPCAMWPRRVPSPLWSIACHRVQGQCVPRSPRPCELCAACGTSSHCPSTGLPVPLCVKARPSASPLLALRFERACAISRGRSSTCRAPLWCPVNGRLREARLLTDHWPTRVARPAPWGRTIDLCRPRRGYPRAGFSRVDSSMDPTRLRLLDGAR